MSVLPFSAASVPEGAPSWTRAWCTSRKPLPRPFVERNTMLCSMIQEAGRGPFLLDLCQRFPMHALCCIRAGATLFQPRNASALIAFADSGGSVGKASEMAPFAKLDEDTFAVVMAFIASRKGDAYLGICENPEGCTTPAQEHAVALPEDMTVLGYWFGVTPVVMRAIYEGRPYKVVRDLAFDARAHSH